MLKNVKWTEIEKNHPNQWALITNIKMKDGLIDSCDVLKICSHAEKVKWIKYFRSQNIKFECERTTFNSPMVEIFNSIYNTETS